MLDKEMIKAIINEYPGTDSCEDRTCDYCVLRDAIKTHPKLEMFYKVCVDKTLAAAALHSLGVPSVYDRNELLDACIVMGFIFGMAYKDIERLKEMAK